MSAMILLLGGVLMITVGGLLDIDSSGAVGIGLLWMAIASAMEGLII